MAIWEIRLVDQPPVRVMVPDERDLIAEFDSAREPRPWWARWRHEPVFWRVTDRCELHTGIVVAVQALNAVPIPEPPRIGFLPEAFDEPEHDPDAD